MPKNPIDYANSLQYKIVCKDPAITDCYNGSTCSLKDRKKTHKSRCSNPNDPKHNYKVYRFIREHGGWDNWTMIQLELSPCKNKQELVLREREIFDMLMPTLNTNSPTLDVEKKKKNSVKYYADNRVEITSYKKQYDADNRVEIAAKKIIYNAEHKVELSAKRKEKVKCACGCVSSKYDLNKHMKTAKHLKLMDQLK